MIVIKQVPLMMSPRSKNLPLLLSNSYLHRNRCLLGVQLAVLLLLITLLVVVTYLGVKISLTNKNSRQLKSQNLRKNTLVGDHLSNVNYKTVLWDGAIQINLFKTYQKRILFNPQQIIEIVRTTLVTFQRTLIKV
jgi:hypothetical protein